jgi:hypothetical protein
MRIKALLVVLPLLGNGFVSKAPATPAATPEALARRAVSADSAESGPAIAALRALGPKGLEMMFQVYGEQIARLTAQSPRVRASDPEWQRLTVALDGVSRQRDSYASRLYWYTDIEQAKAAARATGKPILSLRLLGNLDEEYSCANSRFFRSILYANTEVSAFLRDTFVLHWKSVRPAPRVTIDFGDGRKIERTLTGNSIHYVLDAEGRPIDAIPGLYGPARFLNALEQALSGFRSSSGQHGEAREASLRAYHEAAMDSIFAEFRADITRSGARLIPPPTAAKTEVAASAPTAGQAAPRAITKMGGEIKTLKSIGIVDPLLVLPESPAGRDRVLDSLRSEGDMTEWVKIGGLHAADARLDASSIALIRSQYPSIGPGDAAMSRILQNLERYLAIDTVRNEYLMHSNLHAWFIEGSLTHDVETLNESVYKAFFLTPRSDPWLGLLLPDIYTGLVDGGVVRDR